MNDSTNLPALSSARAPRATYRMQFHAKFRLEDATSLVPYLHALGVSHLYASSYLKARPGSQHGYDIVDHNALNPEIGDEADQSQLCRALADAGMAQLLDVVPNHMGVLERDNAWWTDVVENGPSSPWSDYFDIDWTPHDGKPGQLLLAMLGDQFGKALESGQIGLAFDPEAPGLFVTYFEHGIPVDPATYGQVLSAELLEDGVDTGSRAELQALVQGFEGLAPTGTVDHELKLSRHARVQALKHDMARLAREDRRALGWIERCVARMQGQQGDASSFDRLAALIDRQPWRLAYWRVAAHEVNYRRFFEVNSLAALRMEVEEVFDATHRTILRWLKEGKVAALRIDHPDGLAEPGQYFERLQAHFAAGQQGSGEAPRALYIAVEKILAEHEHWPNEWQVHGDTGYRFANLVNGLFVDSANSGAFDKLYEDFIGRRPVYQRELLESKRYVIAKLLASDLHALIEMAYRIAQTSRRTRDFTRVGLRDALTELAAGMPVYRSYVGFGGVHDIDTRHLQWAASEARRNGVLDETDTLDFVLGLLLEPAPDSARMRFIYRFQQLTSPVMAKAMEDTAFYRYHRLVSLNDVGGDPTQFGIGIGAFHAANRQRQRFMPHCMLGGSTHDSKRSEDVRARLDVLSEMPGEWRAAILRWRELRMRQVPTHEGSPPLEPNDEMLLYQSLVGMLPGGPLDDAGLNSIRERLQAYMSKAMREAKQITSWLRPNEGYEAEVARSIDLLLRGVEPNPFLTDLRLFVDGIAASGYANSLCQVALKLSSPGVPDVYQGCESWNFSLVDPDNRRPVDYGSLQEQLSSLRQAWAIEDGLPAGLRRQMIDDLPDGRLKLLVTWRILALRAELPGLFDEGNYVPLDVSGPAAEHVLAFARVAADGRAACVTVVSRLLHTLGGGNPNVFELPAQVWRDTVIDWLPDSDGRWTNALTGGEVGLSREGERWSLPAGAAFESLPVAVLYRVGDPG